MVWLEATQCDSSFEHGMRASCSQIPLVHVLRHCPNCSKHLLVMVPQSRLGICVRRRQPGDVAVLLLRAWVEAGRRLDVCVCRRRPCRISRGCTAIPLQNQPVKTLGCLRNVWWSTNAGWRRRAAVGLCVHHRGFLARRFAEDLFEVLVAALRRLPAWVAERLVYSVDVELIEQRLMRLLVRLSCEWRHVDVDLRGR